MKPNNADPSFELAQLAAETGDTGDASFVTSLSPGFERSTSASGTWVQALVNLSPLPLARLANEEVSHPPYPPDEAPSAVV